MNIPLHLLPAWITLGIAVFISGYWFKWLNAYFKWLTLFLWLTAAANLFGLYIKHTGTNLSILPALSLVTLLIFTRLYIGNFKLKSAALLTLAVFFAVIVIAFDLYYSYTGLSVRQFFALGTVATDLCIVIFCLCYYWTIIKNEEPLNRDRWNLNSVFLLYFSLSTILFFSINFLVNESLKVVAPFWMLNALSASFLYSFLGYRIWKNGQARRKLAQR
jgi:hypothetical protein